MTDEIGPQPTRRNFLRASLATLSAGLVVGGPMDWVTSDNNADASSIVLWVDLVFNKACLGTWPVDLCLCSIGFGLNYFDTNNGHQWQDYIYIYSWPCFD